MLIPNEVLRSITCSHCGNCLSVFPIHEDNGTYRCGRCPQPSDRSDQSPPPIRQVLYENLASCVEFPCQYEHFGCLERLVPEELQAHENACQHKPFFCQALLPKSCHWKGQWFDVYDHFRDYHSSMILKNMESKINLTTKNKTNYVVKYDGETFVASLECDPDQHGFSCTVKYVGPASYADSFTYQARLVNDRKEIYELPPHPVQMKSADLQDSEGTTFVDIAAINLNLHNPNNVVLKLKLSKVAKSPPGTGKDQGGQLPDEELLRNLKCPVCSLYMLPPIMLCEEGHSICHSCGKEGQKCPVCKSDISDGQNYNLEGLSAHFDYPCRYREFDCNYIGKLVDVKGHERTCKYKPFDCPVEGCTFKCKLSNLMHHIEVAHKDHYLNTNKLTIPYVPGLDERFTYLFQAYGAVFKLDFQYDDEDLYCAVSFVGPPEECSKYLFELKFTTKKCPERIFIRGKCEPLLKDNSSDSKPSMKLGKSLVEATVLNEALNCVVVIVPNDRDRRS